jgi:hypothetical protein
VRPNEDIAPWQLSAAVLPGLANGNHLIAAGGPIISTMRFLHPLLAILACAGGLAGANLVFDNTFGGNQVSSATAIALDSQGNTYAAGTTQSQANGACQIIFVNKWSPDGSTYSNDRRGAELRLGSKVVGRIDSGMARLITYSSGVPKALAGIGEQSQKVAIRLAGRALRQFALQANVVVAL